MKIWTTIINSSLNLRDMYSWTFREKEREEKDGEGVLDHHGTLRTSFFTQIIRVTGPQSTQSGAPVRFGIFCSISIILLASLVAGRRSQYTAGAD
jgi:hypothetical protein